MSMPYTITIKIVCLRRKLTDKEIVDGDLRQHPAWEAPKPKCSPLDMFCNLCKVIDEKAALSQADFYTDLFAVSPEIEYGDVDPNNVMLHLGTAAKACGGSKKAKQGIITCADFCKEFHYFMHVKVNEIDGHHITEDMFAPDGKTIRSKYTFANEYKKLKPHQVNVEEFIWWWKKTESDKKRKEAGLMSASDFFA